jgi:predicted RNase H-like nuclease (RuvC/YqgF family)
MPLLKSTSKGAFSKNVKAEVAAGKPVKQAVAIAYATKREAEKGHHSEHSKQRSEHYHKEVVKSNSVGGSKTKMSKLEQPRKGMDNGRD